MTQAIHHSRVYDAVREKPGVVLVAYLHRLATGGHEERLLGELSREYGANLRVLLVNDLDFTHLGAVDGLDGFPTYVIYREGKELGRLFGEVDSSTMRCFVDAGLHTDSGLGAASFG